ncbi:MAG: adenylate kinase [archaeon]
MRKLIIQGPPGAGKGTRATKISKEFGIPHISTGDMFRKEIKEQTELGKLAKELMDKGHFVPDDITMNMLKNRLSQEDCKNGFILDGVPRTTQQAEMLKEITDIDHVIHLDLSDETILDRLTTRRTCKGCGAIFNIKTIIPKEEGKCDHCFGELVQRDDEKPEVIKERLNVYEEKTKPLVVFYKELNLLRMLDGELDVNDDSFWIKLKELIS